MVSKRTFWHSRWIPNVFFMYGTHAVYWVVKTQWYLLSRDMGIQSRHKSYRGCMADTNISKHLGVLCLGDISWLTSSTLAAVLAEVSMKMRPCSLAKASPSSFFTSRRDSRSLKQQQRTSSSKCGGNNQSKTVTPSHRQIGKPGFS